MRPLLPRLQKIPIGEASATHRYMKALAIFGIGCASMLGYAPTSSAEGASMKARWRHAHPRACLSLPYEVLPNIGETEAAS
jgi:hypothetical protein